MKQTFSVRHETQLRPQFVNAFGIAQAFMKSGKGIRVTVSEETRSLQQNALMWSMLGELSEQVNWYGNKLTSEEWKDVLTASLKAQKAVPGIDGGFVILGARTSQMTISEMNDLIALMDAFGVQQGVKFKAVA